MNPRLLILISCLACACTDGPPAPLTLSRQSPSSTVLSFFSWYAAHQDQLYEYPLVLTTQTGIGQTSFRLQTSVAALQLKYLKESGFFSRDYVWGKEQYFEQLQKNFIKASENGKIPQEVRIDPILRIEDFDPDQSIDLKEIQDIKEEVDGPSATVIFNFRGNRMRIGLAGQEGAWSIHHISTVDH